MLSPTTRAGKCLVNLNAHARSLTRVHSKHCFPRSLPSLTPTDDFGDGPDTAPCDKPNVCNIMEAMIDTKISFFFEGGKVFEARVVAALKPWFTRASTDDRSLRTASRPTNLKEAKQLFQWRGDEDEKAETRRTGADLLFWCAVGDIFPAVRAVLAEQPGVAASDAFNRGLIIDRPDLFSIVQVSKRVAESFTYT